MIDYLPIIAVLACICLLLLLILRFKIPAFLSLLIASITVGIIAGVPANLILQTLETGMGGTLGFVAMVVGLGSLLGGILEHSGGAEAISHRLLKIFGVKHTSWALVTIGFIIAIPVFLTSLLFFWFQWYILYSEKRENLSYCMDFHYWLVWPLHTPLFLRHLDL